MMDCIYTEVVKLWVTYFLLNVLGLTQCCNIIYKTKKKKGQVFRCPPDLKSAILLSLKVEK